MDPTPPEPAPEGKSSTVLGWVSIGLGVWGLTFAVQVWGEPWFPSGDRAVIIPIIRTLVAVGVLQMTVGGVGLLRRRRWGYRASALAGIAWAVSSAAIFLYFLDALSEAGFSVAPSGTVPYLGLWWRIVSGALLVLLYSIGLTTYCLRSATTQRSPRLAVLLLLWTLLWVGVNLGWVQRFVQGH